MKKYYILLLFALLPIQPTLTIDIDFSGCNKTKHCIQVPGDCLTKSVSQCEHIFTFISKEADPTHVEVELYTKRSSSSIGYISVGFSGDTQMGEDAVTHCAIAKGGGVEVHTSQNNGKSNALQTDLHSESSVLELLGSEVTDAHIYCRFRELSTANSNNLLTPDLSKPTFILMARGPASSPTNIHPHSFDSESPDFPYIHKQPIDLFQKLSEPVTDLNDPGSGPLGLKAETKNWLVRMHGILMIVAWLGCISVAVYSARYLRRIWPNSTPLGAHVWFQLHRMLNVAAVLLIVLAAVAISCGNDLKWTGPWFDKGSDINLSASGLHSLAGLLATLLAVSQPIGALLRCGPDHPKRSVFNGFHHTIGYVGLLLALFSITIALFNFKNIWLAPGENNYSFVFLVGFFVLAVVVVIGSEVLRIRSAKEIQRVTSIELHSRNGKGTTPSDTYYYQTQKIANTKHSQLIQILFGAFALLCCITTIALIFNIMP